MKETTENKHNFESAVFKAEYQEILNTSISPSNILSFYERALVKLIALTEKTVKKYKARNSDTPLTGKALEDTAYSEAGLTDISSILEAIEERQIQLHTLQTLIETELEVSSEVFVPPSDERRYALQQGSGNGIEEKLIFPRLLTLLYMLENDLGISASSSEEDENEVEIVQGSVNDSMMRKQPYVRVSIPELKRIVYLCDEEGNATFIFDEEVMEAEDIVVETLDVTDKAVFGELFSKHPELGTRIIYNKEKWRTDILEALINDFGVEGENEEKIKKNSQQQKPKSDFAQHVEVPKKKEGWENASVLQKITHTNINTVKTYAETFRTTHSEWFEVQRSFRGSPSECYHPELVRLIKENFESTPQKKEGWENASILLRILNSSFDTIKEYAETFKQDHPEWFEVQRSFRSRPSECYHPELVRLIKEHFESTPQKKEGWENASTLIKMLRSDFNTIKEYAELFRIDHSEWFEAQKNGSREAEHYHPELVRLIKKYFESTPQKKEGWENATTLSKLLHLRTSSPSIKIYAETFKQEYPEWFEKQKNYGKDPEHYHPELVTLIKEHFNKVPRRKEGWESASAISRVLHISFDTSKEYAETYKQDHPEWFEVQKSRVKEVEHYHPELVTLIKEHFNKVSQKKEGWESASSLSKVVYAGGVSVKNYAETFRIKYPEWFEKQRTGVHSTEHYHPELVQLIKEHFEKKRVR